MTDTKIAVSIIVPVYNVAPWLGLCLDSLIGQTLQNIEIICIDDKSTDNSLEILRQYEKQDKKIVVIALPENGGVSAARNAGLATAKGKYIGFVDSDDYIDPDFYEKLYSAADATDADIAKGEVLITDFDGSTSKRTSCLHKIRKNKIYFDNSFWSAIYSHDFIKKYQINFPPELTVSEDRFFLIQTVSRANKIELVEGTFYHYIRRINSLDSEQYCDEKIKSLAKMAESSVNLINSLDLDTETYNLIFSQKIRLLFEYAFYKTGSIEMMVLIVKTAIGLWSKNKHIDLYKSQNMDYAIYLAKQNEVRLLLYLLKKTNVQDAQIYKLKLLGFIPLLKIKNSHNMTTVCVFWFVPLIKIRHKSTKIIYRLFGLIPFLTKEEK
ncbi:MAG: glycosyltransferase [Alphaproteobacteria bacterium]|nr:glycosyltransferase [Alphaproteobacteria bacterium]